MAELPVDDARALVRALTDLAGMADRALPQSSLTARLQAHLGVTGAAVPNTSASFAPIERANVQIALDHLEAGAAHWEVIGLQADISHFGGASLVGMVSGGFRGPGESAAEYESVETGPGTNVSSLRAGIVLTELDGEAVAAMVYRRDLGDDELRFEIAAATQPTADAFLRRVRELMDLHDVMRGKVLTFSYGRRGGLAMAFATVPAVARHEVILADGQLDAIEEHAFGISEVGDRLTEAGQHLKRGLLLHGPPGTGKTHTVSYLLSRATGRTTVILSGASAGAVGQAGTIARNLQPATIVIEDVDLIGTDRSLPGGDHNPILFQLLNEMDGLAEDVDVLFVLTTNRADLLEPALAARPGRIDQAIEIGLPDARARRALFELYLRTEVDPDVVDVAIGRTAGAAAAFVKELSRRAVLRATRTGASPSETLIGCLDELVEQSSPLLRAALAAPTGE